MIFPCYLNGRPVDLEFAEAKSGYESVNVAILIRLAWIRYRFGPYEGAHDLAELVQPSAMDFGVALMTRGYLALTASDMQAQRPDWLVDQGNLTAWAYRFSKAFKGVPLKDRPYRQIKVHEIRERSEVAYQMRRDMTWLLIFAPKGDCGSFDWESFNERPEAS